MGVFYNLKINALFKKIDEDHESKAVAITSNLSKLPGFFELTTKQRIEIAYKFSIIVYASNYAKLLLHELFHPEYGMFKEAANRNSRGLFELGFDKLYEIMVLWFMFMWLKIQPDENNIERQVVIKKYIDPVNSCLAFDGLNAKLFYDLLLTTQVPRFLCYYRWCILAIGYYDMHYDSMHEHSPDYLKFVKISYAIHKQVDKNIEEDEGTAIYNVSRRI